LVANGVRLLRVEKDYWSEWVFRDEERIPELLDAYKNDAQVGVRQFADACKEVRAALRAA
jgi:hypothetical protein